MASTWQKYQATMQRPRTLWDAARSNDIVELRALADAGADLEARDARGYSALMLAAYAGHAEALDFLLARGADPDSPDAAGNTVLMGAAFRGHVALVRRLLDAGADRHARNRAGLDALGWAIHFGRGDVAALLQDPLRDR